MDDLPLELLSMIMDQLWEDSPSPPGLGPRLTHHPPKSRSEDKLLINLRSMRLVCKAFRHAASNLFGETFFQIRWVKLERESLNELVQISETREFVRYLRCLRISSVGFDQEMDGSGEAGKMLGTAFKNLEGNLTSMLLSLKCTERSRDCQAEAKIVNTVRNALLQSNVQTQRLRIYTNKPNALVLPSPKIRVEHKCMQNLTCLKLDFLNATAVDEEIHTALSHGTIASFISTTLHLERLSIYFASEIWYRAPLKKILGDGVWKGLKSIRMCGFNCRENELTAFLLRHKDTLDKIEFADFKLRSGTWRNVFKTLRTHLTLSTILFRRVWDRSEIFSLSDSSFQGFTAVEFENVDWDKLAVPREESDLDLEPVELGETGMFISFPEDLLYDSEGADDEEIVNPIPYFANELLHPGQPRGEGGAQREDDESTEPLTEEEGSSGRSEISGKNEGALTPRSSSAVGLEDVEGRKAGLVEPCRG